jgi:uncharacterized protein YacL
MIWFVLLIFIALVLVLFGFWLTVTRIKNFREMVEMNRVKAFAEMAEIAKKGKESGTGGNGETGSSVPRP